MQEKTCTDIIALLKYLSNVLQPFADSRNIKIRFSNSNKNKGHTPGQVALNIQSNNEHLLYISDAFLHPVHTEHLVGKAIMIGTMIKQNNLV